MAYFSVRYIQISDLLCVVSMLLGISVPFTRIMSGIQNLHCTVGVPILDQESRCENSVKS